MKDKKQQARHLYLTGTLTQKQIAAEVGVSERTIFAWVHQYAWQKLKTAALQAPATIVDQLSSQLVELNMAIASREPGKRIPTKEESEISQRLIRGINSMKGTQSFGANMQMMQSFRDYVRPLNTRFSQQLAHFADSFFTKKSKAGYSPYQMEYGIEQFAALLPINDELDGDLPVDIPTPTNETITCSSRCDCQNVGNCDYPYCTGAYRHADYAMNAGTKEEPWSLPAAPTPTTDSEFPFARHSFSEGGNSRNSCSQSAELITQTGSNPAIAVPEPEIKNEKRSEEELLKSWKEFYDEVSNNDDISGQTAVSSPKNTQLPMPKSVSQIPHKDPIPLPNPKFPLASHSFSEGGNSQSPRILQFRKFPGNFPQR